MPDNSLSVGDRELFLAEPHIAALAVSVEGPVARTIPGTEEMLRELATRYLPPDQVADYLEFAKQDHGEQFAIYLRPQRWLTADLGPG